jgi:hypothetical protein
MVDARKVLARGALESFCAVARDTCKAPIGLVVAVVAVAAGVP